MVDSCCYGCRTPLFRPADVVCLVLCRACCTQPAVVGTVEFSTHEFSETTLSPSCDTNLPKLYVREAAE